MHRSEQRLLPCFAMSMLLYFSILLIALPSVSHASTDTIFEYDDFNRLTKEIYQDGTAVIYGYDELGRRTSRKILVNSLVINAEAGSNGSISPAGSVIASPGESRKFSIVPDNGYQIDHLMVDGSSAQPDPDSSYTFSNIQANHSIKAYFKPIPYLLTATKNDSGGGVITLAGMTCGDGCSQLSQAYDYGTTNVTLTATPGLAYNFSGWSGCNATQGNTCTVTINGAKSVTANFAIKTYTLTLTASDFGTISDGTNTIVGSNSTGTLTVNYGSGKTFYFNATNPLLYSIASVTINGASIGGAETYTLSDIKANYTIIAAFESKSRDLTVKVRNSDGSAEGGSITGTYGVINNKCSNTCTNSFEKGSAVSLTAIESWGYKFVKWTVCTNSNNSCTTINTLDCSVTIDGDKTATALFQKKTFNLTVNSVEGVTVTGAVFDAATNTTGSTSINCSGKSGSKCGNYYPFQTVVKLTATAKPGYDFTGWDGCVGVPNSFNQCTVTMDDDKTVSASVEQLIFPLTVVKSVQSPNLMRFDQCKATHLGESTAKQGGDIALSPSSNQSCPSGVAGCSLFDGGKTVTLTAAPYDGYAFAGWTGSSCSGTGSCTLLMDDSKNVTAFFKRTPLSMYVTFSKLGENQPYFEEDDWYKGDDYGSDFYFNITPPDGSKLVAIAINGESVSLNPGQPDTTFAATTGLAQTSLKNATTGTGQNLYLCNVTKPLTVSVTVAKPKEFLNLTLIKNDKDGGTVKDNLSGNTCDIGSAQCIFPHEKNMTVTLTAVANDAAHYEFNNWSGCDTVNANICTVTVKGILNVTANFAKKTCTVTGLTSTTDQKKDGTVSGGGTFDCGHLVTMTATPNADRIFTGWSSNCIPVPDNALECTIGAMNTTVTANFAIKTHTISASVDGAGGSISPSGAVSVNHGVGQSFTITADSDYYIADILVDGKSVSLPAQKKMTYSQSIPNVISDGHTIVARFASSVTYKLSVINNYKTLVTISSSPMGINCGPDCNSPYSKDDTVTLTANPKDASKGNNYIAWLGCDSIGDDNSCKVTMSKVKAVSIGLKSFTLGVSVVTSDNTKGSKVTNADISCLQGGVNCAEKYIYGKKVTLTAIPASNKYKFTGWGDPCSGSQSTCTLTIYNDTNVTANFAPIIPTVTVSKTGEGSVTGPGIDCGDTCSAGFMKGTSVTLTANPVDGYNFTWGDACKGKKTSVCKFTVQDNAINVSIAFTIKTYNIRVGFEGTGTASYTDSSGISHTISTTTDIPVEHGGSLTLNFTGGTGWHVADVVIDKNTSAGAVGSYPFGKVTGDHTIKVKFAKNTYTLSVTNNDTDKGNVTGPGINCGNNGTKNSCENNAVEYGATVKLVADPNSGRSFSGWGCPDLANCPCTGSNETCKFTMDQAKSVVANFKVTPANLTITRSPDGGGTVDIKSDPVGYSCGTDCLTYPVNTSVTLTASANGDAGYIFTDWDGACTTTKNTCTITMNKDKSVTAKFKKQTFTITASDNGSGGSISPSGKQTVAFDGSLKFDISPSANYHISDVKVDNVSQGAIASYPFSGVRASHTIKAFFAANPKYKLSVLKSGAGAGAVKSDNKHPGINCGKDCEQDYYQDTSVTLSATPDKKSGFDGWSGCDSTDDRSCTVKVSGEKTVTASFKKK